MPSSESFNFYPRPPRGGRQADLPPDHYHRTISIPALRAEGDPSVFNSAGFQLISIHALREEGDRKPLTERSEVNDFYPRPPRGGRPLSCMTFFWPFDFYPRPPRGGRRFFCYSYDCACQFLSTPSARRATSFSSAAFMRSKFLSTPSARRATRPLHCAGRAGRISIHALREEGDYIIFQQQASLINFYPRPPRGGRLDALAAKLAALEFLSTPSARRATAAAPTECLCAKISIHALREEGDSSPCGSTSFLC